VPESGAVEETEVLARVELEAPFDGAQLYEAAVELGWHPAEGAEAYWVEVAADPDFNVMNASEWGVRDTRHRVEGLEPGEHFWRVSALDRLGLPGQRSLGWRFALVRDETPPFVALLAPEEGAIVARPEVELVGESEPGAELTLNGTRVPVGENGRFATTMRASEGANGIRIEAVDPAGNRTERTRSFVYRPRGAVEVVLDPAIPRDGEGRLLTATPLIDIAGTSDADAGSQLRVVDASGALVVQTLVEEGGGFRFTLPASAEGTAYRLAVLGPGGRQEGEDAFVVRQDTEPPAIVLAAPPPAATANAWLEVAGLAEGAVAVSVNGAPARLAGAAFDAVATLAPGPNAVEVVATDAVGNVAVERLETAFDADPPEILSAVARRPDGEAGPIEVAVEARDGSGLRQAAPFILSVGGTERRGFLRCDGGWCRETLPPEPGELRLVEVIVEDYAGNAAKRQE
jgi:hypothetical protein